MYNKILNCSSSFFRFITFFILNELQWNFVWHYLQECKIFEENTMRHVTLSDRVIFTTLNQHLLNLVIVTVFFVQGKFILLLTCNKLLSYFTRCKFINLLVRKKCMYTQQARKQYTMYDYFKTLIIKEVERRKKILYYYTWIKSKNVQDNFIFPMSCHLWRGTVICNQKCCFADCKQKIVSQQWNCADCRHNC